MRISVSLVRCGRCGKAYSRPLGHVCVTRMGTRRRAARTALRPRLSVTCSKCGKPGNPLTHTCVTRTDWRKRKDAAARQRNAAAEREKRRAWQKSWIERQKAAAARRRAAEKERRRATQLKQREAAKAKKDAARKRATARTHDRERHEPQVCADENCHRYPCRVWREAFSAGQRQGRDEGFTDGYAKGYAQGYPEGMRDCPLPHRG